MFKKAVGNIPDEEANLTRQIYEDLRREGVNIPEDEELYCSVPGDDSEEMQDKDDRRAQARKRILEGLREQGIQVQGQDTSEGAEFNGSGKSSGVEEPRTDRPGGYKRGQRGRGRGGRYNTRYRSENPEEGSFYKNRGGQNRGSRSRGRGRSSPRGRGVGKSEHSGEIHDEPAPVHPTHASIADTLTSKAAGGPTSEGQTTEGKQNNINDEVDVSDSKYTPQQTRPDKDDIQYIWEKLTELGNTTEGPPRKSQSSIERKRRESPLGKDGDQMDLNGSLFISDTKPAKSKRHPTRITVSLNAAAVVPKGEHCSKTNAVSLYIGTNQEYEIEEISDKIKSLEVRLVVQSKAKARKLCKELFEKSGTVSVTILNDKESSQNRERKSINNIKSVFLNSLQTKTDHVLKTHQKKIDDFIDKLTWLRSHTSAPDLYKPLEGKRDELIAQKVEFQQAVQTLQNRVQQSVEAKIIVEMELCGKIFMKECKKLDAALPMYAQRSHILQTVANNQVTILMGETGSGKSTQVPLYLVETGMGKHKPIVCTQPRKVAVMSLAKHVANEMGSSLGTVVGHRIGKDSKTNKGTELLYMTDHSLLNDCLKDPDLSQYSCVIVDEAHERSIYTDLLLGMVKKCLARRPDLKVIITSATINPELFVTYFGECPVLRVPGRLYPVSVQYREQPRGPEEDYLDEAVKKVLQVHRNEGSGDILVFLATPAETERAYNRLDGYSKDLLCLQLHGKLQPEDQQKVFTEAPDGQRKVIFSTNVAETSVTIPGVAYVIDTGMCKEKTYDAKRNMGVLEISAISKSSAEQRKGRAGRTGPGKCFRLFTEKEYDEFVQSSIPEIKKVHLGQAMLKLMDLGIDDPLSFDFVEAPPDAAIKGAIKALQEIGAVNKDTCKITELGKKLSKIALEPRLGKLVLDGINTECALEAIVICAFASSGSNAYYRGGTEEEKSKADSQKTLFCHEDGDFISFLTLYKQWEKVTSEKERSAWCVENSINAKTMRVVRKQVHEIRFNMKKELGLKVEMEFNDSKPDLHQILSKILLTCYPSQLCHFSGHKQAGYILSSGDACYYIHPSSALMVLGQTPKWVLYNQLLQTSKDFMLNLTVVKDEIVEELKTEGHLKIDEENMQKRLVSGQEVRCIGKHLLGLLAGPGHRHRRSLETKISEELGGIPVKIHLDFEHIRATVYTPSAYHSDVESRIQCFLEKERSRLQNEKEQVKISPDSPISAILGAGGALDIFLMPGEFRVFYMTIPSDKFNSYFRETFEAFGEVRIFQYPKCKVPGRVQCAFTYLSAEAAKNAFSYALDIKDCNAWHEKSADPTRKKETFKLDLRWIRRPNKGVAFINFSDDEEAGKAFSALSGDSCSGSPDSKKSINIQFIGKQVALKRTGKDLKLSNLNHHLTNKEIHSAITKMLLSKGFTSRICKTVVPREEEFNTSPEDIENHQKALRRLVTDLVPTSDFKVTMTEPKAAGAVEQYASVTFDSENARTRVLESLQYEAPKLQYLSKRVVGTKFLKSEIAEAIHDSLNDYQMSLCGNDQDLTMKKSEKGHWFLTLSATSVELFSEMQATINKISSPSIIDCSNENTPEGRLLDPNQRSFLNKIAKDTSTGIYQDIRCKRINITGTAENKLRAKERIEGELKTLDQQCTERIQLTGSGWPRALLRTLIKRFGLKLDDLVSQCNLQSARLNIRRHLLVVAGERNAVENVRDVLERMKRELQQEEEEEEITDPEDTPDCSVCYCQADKLFRLNSCGHPYCFTCVTDLVSNAISNCDFPLICAGELCSEPLVIKDIKRILGENFKDIIEPAVSCYVQKNRDKARYCITPDCSSVYRVTPEASLFVCPVCSAQICASCGSPHHEGLTCKQNEYEKVYEKIHLQLWLNEDKKNRRICPGCNTGIELINGCNKMHCAGCGIVFCWVCRMKFSNSSECYSHLTKVHGGCFDVPQWLT